MPIFTVFSLKANIKFDYFTLMKLYVGMVTLNCFKYTLNTLSSFVTSIPHTFMILDNNSTDDTRSFLEKWGKLPNHEAIYVSPRVCVAKAWNTLLTLAMHDKEFKYCYLINNDIIFEPYVVDHLVTFVEAHPEYKIVSGINTRDFKKNPGQVDENHLDCAAFLITRECIEKVGFFDENFVEAYFEDNDYHQRVFRAGLKSCIVSDVGFFHIGSRTIHEGFSKAEQVEHHKNFERNREYFRKKWGFVP